MALPRALVALAMGMAVAGCSDSQGSGACAVAVTPEVCETPANLRGAERVSETWTSEPAPELVGEPLHDGRYVQTARTLYCAEQYDPPPVLSSVQSVLEISGCVIRVTTFYESGEQPLIGVASFAYRTDGTLDLHLECAAEPKDNLGQPYGFDGSTLRIPASSGAYGPEGQEYDCQSIDTWELR